MTNRECVWKFQTKLKNKIAASIPFVASEVLMVGKKDNISLVEEYRKLRKEILHNTSVDSVNSDPDRRLDTLYALIISRPVVDIRAALEKLWFAHHCLTEEDDYKEASNLIFQVCVALESLSSEVSNQASVA
jgi:hypothetical protein